MACKSVFAARNSTPLTLSATIRLMAFPPAPPTPTTLIEANFFTVSELIFSP